MYQQGGIALLSKEETPTLGTVAWREFEAEIGRMESRIAYPQSIRRPMKPIQRQHLPLSVPHPMPVRLSTAANEAAIRK